MLDAKVETSAYFAALSEVSLESVCSAIQSRYSLPQFVIDDHDTWSYGVSWNNQLHINITKAQDTSTIETWMPDCPEGVNFQVVVESDDEPPELISTLRSALEAEPVAYASRHE